MIGDDTAATLRAKYVTQIGAYDFANFEGVTYFADETAYRSRCRSLYRPNFKRWCFLCRLNRRRF